MLREGKSREYFLAIAMGIIILSPMFTLLFPRAVADTLHYSSSHFVLYVTNGTYLLYFIGFFFFFASSLFIYFLGFSKSSTILAVSAILIGSLCFYIGSKHYIALGNDAISYKLLLSTKEYAYKWEDVEQVFYKPGASSNSWWQYEFVFHDGEELTVVENAHIQEVRNIIINRLKEENINIKN